MEEGDKILGGQQIDSAKATTPTVGPQPIASGAMMQPMRPIITNSNDIIFSSPPTKKSKKKITIAIVLSIFIATLIATTYFLISYFTQNSITAQECLESFNELSNFVIDGEKKTEVLEGEYSGYHIDTYKIFSASIYRTTLDEEYINDLNKEAREFYDIAKNSRINHDLKNDLINYSLFIIGYTEYVRFYDTINELEDEYFQNAKLDKQIYTDRYQILINSDNPEISKLGNNLLILADYEYEYLKILAENNCLSYEEPTNQCGAIIYSNESILISDDFTNQFSEAEKIAQNILTVLLQDSWKYAKELQNEVQ